MAKKKNIDNETKEIIDSFVSEGYDLIEDAEEKIIKLDSVHDKEVINTIFRMFHSIKGSAGYLNFNNIKKVTHEAEALLDIFRKKDIKPSQETIDLLYQTLDFLKQLIMNVEKELTDEGFEEHSQIIIHNINQCIGNLKFDLGEDDVKNIEDTKKKEENKKSDNKFITNEMIDNFLSELNYIFDNVEEKLLKLEKDINNKELISDIFRDIHTLKGNCGLFGHEELEDQCIDIEAFLDDVRNNKKLISQNNITSLLKKIDYMRNILKVDEDETKTDIKKKDENKIVYNKPLGEILIEIGEVDRDVIEKALEIQNSTKPEIPLYADTTFTRKDVRIDTKKLDLLFDTIGELVTASAMVINNPDLEGLKLDNFKKSAANLGKIARDLQEISMSMRMIPLENLFIKMKRLVRDLSRKFNKKIQFNISGQDTEMDRNVIEQISDPLVHILRNAIDHGIEDKKTRLKNNKNEIGSINLSAKYEGNEIWIIIEDDGAGLDRDKIMKKVIDSNLFKGDPDKLVDEEVWNYIFFAGFTTVSKVSEVSGRGVGMDVVKRNIEKLRGNIKIESKKNNGTKFILKIPLTLAIMEGITLRVGSNLYSIPTTDIQEFFEVDESQITRTDEKNYVIKLRDEILPVIKLYEVFNIPTIKEKLTEGIIIVVKSNNKKACLLVDEVLGNHQIVVKSLSDYLGDVVGISGCTIMGNGEVSLIIDTGNLIKKCIN